MRAGAARVGDERSVANMSAASSRRRAGQDGASPSRPCDRYPAVDFRAQHASVSVLRCERRRRHRPHAAIFSSTTSIRAKPAFAPFSTPYCIVVSRSRSSRSASSASASSAHRDPRTRASEGGSGMSVRGARVARPRGTRLRRRRRTFGTYTCRRDGRPSPRRPCRRPTIPDQLRVGPDGEDVRGRRVKDPLDADLELVRGGNRGLVHRQLTACLRSFAILASSALVSFVNAKATGHIDPSSRLAVSLKPSIA